MLWLLTLIFTTALLAWTTWRIKNRKLLATAKQLPGPPTIPVLGNALTFLVPSEELHTTFGNLIRDYGDTLRFWLGPNLNVVVSDPNDVKTLLKSSKTATKGPQYKFIADFCGDGVLSGSGPSWRKRRKEIAPNFGKKAVGAYSAVFNREADILIQELKSREAGKTFDIFNDLVRCTSYSAGRTVFGLTRDETINLPHLDSIVYGAHEMYQLVFMRMTKWYLQVEPLYWFTEYYDKHRTYLKQILEMSEAIVNHRRKALNSMNNDLKFKVLYAEGDSEFNIKLSPIDRMLLSNQKPSKKEEVLKQVFTMFTASQEATAKVSSYLLLMMAYHQECQEKLYKEIKKVFGDSERDVTDDDIKEMPYLDMVFKEVIRLFPTGVVTQRTVSEDIEISRSLPSKITLPAGCSLVIPTFFMQRDQRYWRNPDAFDPERFSPENSDPNRCFLPFSLGPMDCIGRYFGIKLVKTVCTKLLRSFRLASPEKYEDLRIELAISVASVSGFPVQVYPRN